MLGITELSVLQSYQLQERLVGFKMMKFSPIYLRPSLLLLNFEKTAMRLRFD